MRQPSLVWHAVIARVLLALLAAGGIARADGSAQLAIATDSGAAIQIDGAPAEATTTVGAGRHVVVVTARGRKPEARVVDLELWERKTLAISLVETDQRRVVPWLVGGAATAGLGAIVATAFAASASATASRIEHERETTGITAAQLGQYQRALDHHDRDLDLAIGAGIGAIVLGATALGLYWFDEHAAIVVQPGGAAVVGRF